MKGGTFQAKRYFTIVTVVIILSGMSDSSLLAQGRPVKEFNVTVQETTIALLEDPKKEVTVWAYALKGDEPTVPGPIFRVTKGDLVRIHFSNTHHLPHTMHFHGVHPFNMDGNGQRNLGTEQLQLPGESYTYEWIAEDPGYYLYHCHFDTANHIDHGMYGLLIVEDPAWPSVDREILTVWDEWDTDGDGTYDTHTINTRSAPSYVPMKANVGERVRLILANIGFELHTPHLHGQKWLAVNFGNLRSPVMDNPNGVVAIGPAEIKIVEFVPKYAGTWLFHCHVVPHVADDGKYPRGMLTLLQVTDEEASQVSQTAVEKPPDGEESDPSQETQMASIQPLDYPEGNAESGYDIFKNHCTSCHGDYGEGGYGPKLEENPILHDDEKFWQTVLKGRGNMPAWKESLSFQEIADVQAYLKTLMPAPPP